MMKGMFPTHKIFKLANTAPGRLFTGCCIAACVLPVIFGFFFIHYYAVNVPYWDQWDSIVPWTVHYFEGNFEPRSLLNQGGDSRPVVPNLLMLCVSIAGSLNIKWIFYAGYLIYIAGLLVLFSFLKGLLEKSRLNLILFLPLFYYSLNPYFLGRFIQNLGSIYYPAMLFAAFLTVYFLAKARDSFFYFPVAAAGAVICSFSYVAGLCIWPAGLFQLLLLRARHLWGKVLLWIACAAFTVYVYFFSLDFLREGMHSTAAYASFLKTALYYPGHKFLCFMGTLGAEIKHTRDLALGFGCIIFVAAVVLVYTNRHRLHPVRFAQWYAMLAFGTLTSLQVTLARSGSFDYFGSPKTLLFIPDHRHSLAIFLPLLCIYALAVLYNRESFRYYPAGEEPPLSGSFLKRGWSLNSGLLALFFILICFGALLHVSRGTKEADAIRTRQLMNRDILKNYKTAGDAEIEMLHPDPRTVRYYAPYLEKHHLSIFSR